MQDTEARPPTPDVPLPRRIRMDNPNRHGIVLDHRREYTALISWCRTMHPRDARPLIQIARALVDNAHQHSKSGLPGGTIRVVLDKTRPMLPHLFVTDQGPLDASTIDYPHLNARNPRSGLALVERLSAYWDFSWDWDDTHIKHTTVQVVLDPTKGR